MPRELEGLCVGIAVLGIASLFAYSKTLQPTATPIEQLTMHDAGSWVSIQGWLASFRQKNGHWFLSVCTKTCISVFIPKNWAQKLNASLDETRVRPGAFVRVQGKLEVREGALEIVAFQSGSLEVSRASARTQG